MYAYSVKMLSHDAIVGQTHLQFMSLVLFVQRSTRTA